jgi:hypothetical protein
VRRLVAVLRHPLGVFALVSDRVRPFELEPAAWDDPYSETLVPLAQVSEAVCAWKDKDVRAWRALARVPTLTRRSGLAIVRAIIGSAVDPSKPPGTLPPLRFDRGPVDLRPHLCDPDGEQELLDGLGETLEQVSEDIDFPDWHWNRRRAIAMLPDEFRRSFLWGLHLSPWRQLERTLAVYEALALEDDPVLRRGMARLLSFADRPTGIEWAEVLVEVDPADRARACELILESGAYRRSPSDAARRALAAREWATAAGSV